jgi:hypothetical protein
LLEVLLSEPAATRSLHILERRELPCLSNTKSLSQGARGLNGYPIL